MCIKNRLRAVFFILHFLFTITFLNRLLRSPSKIGKLRRLDGAGLVWLAQYEKKMDSNLPFSWKGEGANPIAVFKG
ncbi:MAG: Uncharacterised protein [Flavobacteriaceae bacterium]|nr:MAG: Uncharacterised protein [Flavobacteriaceae bacterium]